MSELNREDVIGLTADIVSAFVSNNPVRASDLPDIIASVHTSLVTVQAPKQEPLPEKREPAVSIKKSVTDDFIICLEDGKKFKSLKRHLQTSYGMTPDEYRAKWDLPASYPMVAPGYAARRSELARATGLGRKPANAAATDEAAAPANDETDTPRRAAAKQSSPAEAVSQEADESKPARKPRAKKVA